MPAPMSISCQGLPPGFMLELTTRVLLFCTFFYTENLNPFVRVIQPEEYWLYRFPTETSIVSSDTLWVSDAVNQIFKPWVIIISGITVIGVVYGFNRERREAYSAMLVITMALPLTGIITNIIKVAVGRPRPDYFNRCYGANYMSFTNLNQPCTGDIDSVLDGRKSFPSGHSSMSFCIFGFVFLYIAGQLKTFVNQGQPRSWKLLFTIFPLLPAALIAISRTCDYHHHWQDITVGSILGFTVVYAVYRQYFYGLSDNECDKSYTVRQTYINGNLESVSVSQSEGQIRSILRMNPVQHSNSKNTIKTV